MVKAFFGVVVGGDGGILPRPLGTPSERGKVRWVSRLRGKSACGLKTEKNRAEKEDTKGNWTTPERETLRPVRASATDPPDRSPRTVSIRSGGGRAFCGGAPEEAGTSMAIAGRGGNDEGAKHDAL